MQGNQIIIISLIVSGISIIIATVSLIAAVRVRQWRTLFQTDHQPDNLEDIIVSITKKIEALEVGQTEHENQINKIFNTLSHAIQHVGIVRFNSLADEGGNLSFALALLDEHKTGAVLTSLYGRQGNRLYTKKIIEGVGETGLNEEEQNALFQALAQHNSKK